MKATADRPQTPPGPIFIVGLSRSGTKLLRAILNRHRRIHIPERESYFIPYVLTHFARRSPTPDPQSRRAFVRYFQQGEFYRHMQELGLTLPTATLDEMVETSASWPAVIESIFLFYSRDTREGIIWGDKTPKYLKHLLLLRRHFPQARFLHICRDPRDRALSARDGLGANLYISAQQWLESMRAVTAQATALGGALKTVHYEALVAAPGVIVPEICAFLGVEYEPAMLGLSAPVERMGDPEHPTRQRPEIYAGNTGKYRNALTPGQLARIEQIVFPYAAQFGYQPELTGGAHRPLGFVERLVFTLPHAAGSLQVLTSRWGLWHGMRYAVSRLRL